MQPKFCIRCGSPLIEGDSFCRKCGTRISMPGAVPQQGPAYESSKAKIPGYKEIKARFTGSAETGEPEKKEDPRPRLFSVPAMRSTATTTTSTAHRESGPMTAMHTTHA